MEDMGRGSEDHSGVTERRRMTDLLQRRVQETAWLLDEVSGARKTVFAGNEK